MPISRVFLLIAALLATTACTQSRLDATTEGQKLLRRDAEWAEAASAGKDIDKIVSYWSDDAVVMEPGQPVYDGKAAIRKFVAESLATPGFKIHWVSEKPVFSPDGMMAYIRSVNETTVPGTGGALMTLHLQGISVWSRNANGEWFCVADIANEAPSAASRK